MSDDGILSLAQEPVADGVKLYRTVERPFFEPQPDFPRDADVSREPRGG
jgi:hypothetical protein